MFKFGIKFLIFMFSALNAPRLYASQCELYLSRDGERLMVSEMVENFSLYSPWYYNYMQMNSDPSEIASAFKDTSDEKLQNLALTIYENLINRRKMVFNPLIIDEQVDVIFKSLVAIKNSGRFPQRARLEEVSDELILKLAKGTMIIGGIAFLGFAGSNSLNYQDWTVYAAGSSAGVGIFGILGLSMNYSTIIQPESSEPLVDFILSLGKAVTFGSRDYFNFGKNGQAGLGFQYDIRLGPNNRIELHPPETEI